MFQYFYTHHLLASQQKALIDAGLLDFVKYIVDNKNYWNENAQTYCLEIIHQLALSGESMTFENFKKIP